MAYFPLTLHADIVATLGLDLDGPSEVREAMPITKFDANAQRRRRDPRLSRTQGARDGHKAKRRPFGPAHIQF